ncbi:hypothetical protein ES703_75748 [subsurface metagenome]
MLERDTGAAWVEVVRGEAAIRLAQLAERAHSSLSGIGVADHHARYTDAEAQATVKANVEVGDLKAPTKALDMNGENILNAGELHGTTYWG